jgi:hypothetical protein
LLAELIPRRRVAVRGPHGIGKTTIAAWIVLWAVLTAEDVKVPTTASVWRQLSRFLWPEIHKQAGRLRWELVGRSSFTRDELMLLSLRLSPTCEAFAAAVSDPAHIEGAHAERVVYIYDEAKTIPDEIFDASEGAFAGAGTDTAGEAYALALSTPGEPHGRFYDIHSRAIGYRDWWVRHVTLEEAITAGRISREWAEARHQQWGEQDPRYQNRVLGEFAASATDGIIPLAWIELANERWRDLEEASSLPTTPDAIGVDVGLTGDATVLAPAAGNTVIRLDKHARGDTMVTAGRITGPLLRYPGCVAVVDSVGIGAGVKDRVEEQVTRGQVLSFSAGRATPARDRSGEFGFADLRSAGWWGLREMLEPSSGTDVALPPDDELTGDLTAPRWTVTSGGRIRVESKDSIRKRLGRSTDCGDAVMQVLAGHALVHTGVLLG